MGTEIVAGGERFDIGVEVKLWTDSDGFNAYPMGRFNKRTASLQDLQSQIKQLVFHHSVNYTAKATFGGLAARGLSCTFIIDDDGVGDEPATIYQTLDIKEGAWSQKPLNNIGAGIEISYMPQAWKDATLYSEDKCKRWGVQPREIKNDSVNGAKFRCFGPSEGQMKSLAALAWGYSELFPSIPCRFPRDGIDIVKATLKQPELYSGFLCHYHITREKIDALGLDMERVERDVEERKARGF